MTHSPRIIAPPPGAAGADAPLCGATILWTRADESGDAIPTALAAAGATLVLTPVIEFRELAARKIEMFLLALDHLREWRGWLILPSPTAIRYFAKLMEAAGLTPPALAGIRIAVIGEGSAAALESAGLARDFLAPEPSATSLAAELPLGATGAPVMIAGSSQSRPELQEGLKRRGARVQLLALYDPVPSPEGLRMLEEALEKHPEALLAAASPSAVDAIMDWFDTRERPRPAAEWLAIGATTRQRLLDSGVAPEAAERAATPDAAGLAAAAACLLARRRPPEAPRP